jgi:hypothetical protein
VQLQEYKIAILHILEKMKPVPMTSHQIYERLCWSSTQDTPEQQNVDMILDELERTGVCQNTSGLGWSLRRSS